MAQIDLLTLQFHAMNHIAAAVEQRFAQSQINIVHLHSFDPRATVCTFSICRSLRDLIIIVYAMPSAPRARPMMMFAFGIIFVSFLL